MKITIYILATLLLFLTISCVQKAKKRVVIYTVDVSKVDGIKKVGIRGWDNPLSWERDYLMKEIAKDSLYQVTITSETGRICNEFKFSVNENQELEGKENRKIYFSTKSDTTKATFVFNKE